MNAWFLFAVVVVVWVYVDARSIGVRKGLMPGSFDMSAEAWALLCLLIWVVGLPLYLSKRGELRRLAREGPATAEDEGPELAEDEPPASLHGATETGAARREADREATPETLYRPPSEAAQKEPPPKAAPRRAARPTRKAKPPNRPAGE